MNGRSQEERMEHDIGRQATAWLVKLSDEPENEALRVEFVDWLAASPAHLAAWEETERVSGLMTALGPLHASAPPVPAEHRGRFPARGRARVRALATLTLSACLAWLVAPDMSLWIRSDEITRTAELRVVRLKDGSIVHLAPASAIAFTNGAKGRSVDLLRGEVWFDVAHDVRRPFRVVAGDSTVTVLGTAFTVRRTGSSADVAVQRGRVAVATPDAGRSARIMLSAGESVSVVKGTALRGTIRPDRVAGWREGVAIVNDEPIGAVLDRLRPWYSGYILATGPGLENRRVSGIYDLRDPDLALEALKKAHTVRVSKVSPWLRIVTVG